MVKGLNQGTLGTTGHYKQHLNLFFWNSNGVKTWNVLPREIVSEIYTLPAKFKCLWSVYLVHGFFQEKMKGK